jgi:hypothetical protein
MVNKIFKGSKEPEAVVKAVETPKEKADPFDAMIKAYEETPAKPQSLEDYVAKIQKEMEKP